MVDHAYARWLATQGESSPRWKAQDFDGWLIGVGGLHDRRAPGNTCLAALRAAALGPEGRALNDSKGCGGVMRIAPVGLLNERFSGDRFELGCEVAGLTHGHPSGYLAAGALAEIVHHLVELEVNLDAAIDRACARFRQEPRHEETLQALEAARRLAASQIEPSPEVIATLGEGQVAEEALAIGVYCALVAKGFEHGVLLAINHSGDSDSTGAIAGNILGALLGGESIAAGWIEQLEMSDVIERVCRDWEQVFVVEPPVVFEGNNAWWERYPGW